MVFPLSLDVRTLKALGAVLLGGAALMLAPTNLLTTWPLVVVYLMLVWKEYATYGPRLSGERPGLSILRIIRVAAEITVYALLALSFPRPLRFAVLMAVFLLVETVGYGAEALRYVDCVPFRRRVKMSAAQFVLALAVLLGIALAYTQMALVFWGILATDVTLYFVIFRGVGGEACTAR